MLNLNKIFAALILLILIFFFFAFYSVLQKIKITPVSFPQHNLNIQAETAKNPYQLAKGLMFRKSLDENKGMLFTFPNEAYRSFWMKNTKIPLDLIFISKDKKIVDIKENFLPCSQTLCPSYKSILPAKYVLEVNAGFVQKNKVLIGEEMSF
ncbi:MAG: DUF192 domain-containing protein [Candidatus Paceibacterota bacterium]|jgi:hypothetical protein